MAIRTAWGSSLIAAISLPVWLSGAAAAASIDWSGCDPAKGDDAIAACSQLIQSGKLKPNDLFHAYLNRGLAEKSKGKLNEAIADFDKATQLNPKDPTIYLNRGVARQLRDYEPRGDARAVADFDQAIKLKPDYAEAYSKRADARFLDLDGQIADLTTVVQLDPNFPDVKGKLGAAYKYRGDMRQKKNYLDGAIADYNQALQLDPRADIYSGRCTARSAKGDIDGALADCDEAIRRASADDAGVYVDRASARQRNSDLDGAIADLSKAIQINPNYTPAYSQRGGLWEVKGDYGRARADYSAALATKTYTSTPSEAKKYAQARLAALNPSQLIQVPLNAAGGTFEVPVEINGAITLNFVIDSGAADVTIPADVVSTLIRMGTIKPSDFIGRQTYVLADGSESPSSTFMIRSLKVGDKIVENVKGSIAPATGALLLGQSFLQHFKSWSIDNLKHELLLEPAN
jgi:tetratricopeptide (TPR) repeat protein